MIEERIIKPDFLTRLFHPYGYDVKVYLHMNSDEYIIPEDIKCVWRTTIDTNVVRIPGTFRYLPRTNDFSPSDRRKIDEFKLKFKKSGIPRVRIEKLSMSDLDIDLDGVKLLSSEISKLLITFPSTTKDIPISHTLNNEGEAVITLLMLNLSTIIVKDEITEKLTSFLDSFLESIKGKFPKINSNKMSEVFLRPGFITYINEIACGIAPAYIAFAYDSNPDEEISLKCGLRVMELSNLEILIYPKMIMYYQPLFSSDDDRICYKEERDEVNEFKSKILEKED